MRILHVYQTYFPDTQGGLEEAIRQICLATSALGVHNSIFCCGFQGATERYTAPEAEVVKTPRWFKKWSCTFPRVSGIADFRQAAAKADVLHYHLHWPVADLLDFFIPNKPLIITYHSDLVRQQSIEWLYAPLRRRLFRRAYRIVATSPEYAASSAALTSVRHKVTAIPLCMDMSALPSKAREDFVFYIGMLRYYKGLDVLLDAAKRSKRKILIAGKGELAEHLSARIANENIRNVTLLGAITDAEKADYMSRCAALVLPSINRAEAFGVVLLEALRTQTPVITTALESGNAFVARAMGGALVPPLDAVALADAIDRILPVDPAKYQSAQAQFGHRAVGKAYQMEYREAMCANGVQ